MAHHSWSVAPPTFRILLNLHGPPVAHSCLLLQLSEASRHAFPCIPLAAEHEPASSALKTISSAPRDVAPQNDLVSSASAGGVVIGYLLNHNLSEFGGFQRKVKVRQNLESP